MTEQDKKNFSATFSYTFAACALILTMVGGLLAALYAGLLAYSLVHMLAPALGRKLDSQRARIVAVAVLGTTIVIVLIVLGWSVTAFFLSEAGSLPVLIKKLADLLDQSRAQIPDWIAMHLPESAEALKQLLVDWLREHASEAKTLGEQAGRTAVHLLLGLVIGALAAMYDTTHTDRYLPLAAALHQRTVTLHQAFRQVVFAQLRIAAINTVFTGIFLLLILPMAGIELPFTKTLVLITFIAGLLPVIGNLISNTAIVIVGLTHSLSTAVIALVFLVAIHKLEYFLNARIIGSHINARAWELLAAMLVMESLFGLPGVVAAPVFYAYIKLELAELKLI